MDTDIKKSLSSKVIEISLNLPIPKLNQKSRVSINLKKLENSTN